MSPHSSLDDSAASEVRHSARARPTPQHQPIAIVGMSCRFAGEAKSASDLWKLCEAGDTAWSPIPAARFDVKSFYHPDKNKPGKNHAIGGYFFDDDIASFDAGFFNLPADSASTMDPQIRLLLESVYEAMENAGILLDSIAGTDTSVFTGCWSKDYHELQARDPDALPASFLTGNGTAMLSNRISHFFDLCGASMSIDTGCSSGLVALHQACRSLLWGDANMAIVAASNVLLSPDLFIALSNQRMTGVDGKCYAWDSRAQGYGRGEGVAALILKPLDAALRDNDHIHALVRETGLNQDGKTRTLTSPSVAAQVKLIESCYERAGLSLSETGYVEAHMTGTLVGDLAEAEALAKTFGKSRAAHDPVLVGSVKTNIGHTEPVSGLAAIIKTALALKARRIPPNLNYEAPNPKIKLQEWNLHVPTSVMEWPKDKPLRASINNFGYGGANAHVILEAAPENEWQRTRKQRRDNPGNRIFIVSAKDSFALKGMITKLANYARASVREDTLGDLAYTLSERRSRMSWVAAVRARDKDELVARWTKCLSQELDHSNRPPRLGFVFNGQGAQWHAMGRELMKIYPTFDCAMRRADEILRDCGSTWSLRDELMRDAEATRVSEVNISQPITAALQLCLVDLLRSWGIKPSAVASHSSGEIAAAYAVGRLSFEEALGIAYWRGELAHQSTELKALSGGMMAVRIAPQDVSKYISNTPGGKVVVACVNSPSSVTLSGDMLALEGVAERLQADGLSPRRLNVPLAYHSHHMLSMEQGYVDQLKSILSTDVGGRLERTSEIRFASPVTGDIVYSSEILTAEHWARNLTNPVLFSQALERMCFAMSGTPEVDMIVEVGAHSTLAGPIHQVLAGRKISYTSCLQRSVDAVESMQNLACDLLNRGYPVSITAINSPMDESHTFLSDLPTYAWNHNSRYWTEPRISRELRDRRFEPQELLGSLLPANNGLAHTWRNFLRLADIPWLDGQDFNQGAKDSVLSTAIYIAMAIEALRLLEGSRTKDAELQDRFRLRNVEILGCLTIPDSSAGIEIQTNLRPLEGGWYGFRICTLADSDEWSVCCEGRVSAMEEQATDGATEASFQKSFTTEVERNRSVTDCDISSIEPQPQNYVIHPTTLRSVLQTAHVGVSKHVRKAFAVVPRSIHDISIHHSVLANNNGERLQAHVEIEMSNGHEFTSEVTVLGLRDGQTVPAFCMDGFVAQVVPRDGETSRQAHLRQPSTSRLEWELDAWNHIPPSVKDAMRIRLGDQQAAFEKKMLRMSYYLIHDAVHELNKSSEEMQVEWQPHHKKLFGWMKDVAVAGEQGVLAPRSHAWSRSSQGAKQLLVDDLNSSGDASARLTIRVGKGLTRIVRGEISPLELMTEGNLLSEYYMSYPKLKDRTYKHLSKLCELLLISRPGINLLEIGAGTGGATQVVLEAASLTAKGGHTTGSSLLGHYTFTDISSGFFGAAREKFAPWAEVMDFRPLNIGAGLQDQSFSEREGTYDVAVASLVLHATESLHSTLANVRKLLKPGGKLLLIETTTDRLDMQLIFGTLPGWWLGQEPYRKRSPNAPCETWDRILRESGFTGVEFDIGDCEQDEFQCTSLIMTTAATTNVSYSSAISIVYLGKPGPPALGWLHELGQAIHQRTGVIPAVEHFDGDANDWHNKICVFAAEIDGPFVHGIDRHAFDKLRQLLVGCRDVLWLSCGGAMDAGLPHFAETYGLLRALRQEDTSKQYVHLDFEGAEDGNNWTRDQISHIVWVFQQNFGLGGGFIDGDLDCEYSVKGSVMYVPRLYPDKDHESVRREGHERQTLPLDGAGATYLVVGATGGIGQAIVAWMIEKGAKNVLAISRAATDHREAAKWSAKARERGCNLQFRSCDVSSQEDLLNLLADCSGSLPPIRGAINAAMVLDDTVFERMTWDQWRRATQAKVATSTNLHLHLPELQFLVLLSSVTGVAGHRSQANYCAGNTFQDALARHRTARGQPAVAVDLGAVDSVGWVARQRSTATDDAARRRVESLGAASVSVDAVLELLEAAICDFPLRVTPAESQVIVGLSQYASIPDASSVVKRDRRFGTLRLGSRRPPVGEDLGRKTTRTASGAKDSMAALLAAMGDRSGVSPGKLTQMVADALTSKMADIFNTPPDDIDRELPLSRYGVDSLVAVDLRNWLVSRLQARISVSEIIQASSVPSLAALVASRSSGLRDR